MRDFANSRDGKLIIPDLRRFGIMMPWWKWWLSWKIPIARGMGRWQNHFLNGLTYFSCPWFCDSADHTVVCLFFVTLWIDFPKNLMVGWSVQCAFLNFDYLLILGRLVSRAISCLVRKIFCDSLLRNSWYFSSKWHHAEVSMMNCSRIMIFWNYSFSPFFAYDRDNIFLS